MSLAASPAAASQLVARDATHVALRVDTRGTADVRYKAGGNSHRVIYWGSVNGAIGFRYDRSAGWRSGRINPKAPFVNRCGAYRGPKLPFVVKACTTPKGDHWVLQSWARIVPNYGGQTGRKELRLAHFTGPAAKLQAGMDWSWNGMWAHVYGTLTYQGVPIFGQLTTVRGYVLDGRGRNIAVESLSADYPGAAGRWSRVNMFLAHKPSGQFCLGVSPKSDAALPDPLWQWGRTYTGRSSVEQYRARVAGPGVSPDVETYFSGWHRHAYEAPDAKSTSGWRYNEAGRVIDEQANAYQATFNATSGSCARIN